MLVAHGLIYLFCCCCSCLFSLLFCNARYCKSDNARALLVQKITALLRAVRARKPNPGDIGSTGKVVQKKVVPMVFQLLGRSSVAFRADLEQLLHVLLEINPEACDNEVSFSF